MRAIVSSVIVLFFSIHSIAKTNLACFYHPAKLYSGILQNQKQTSDSDKASLKAMKPNQNRCNVTKEKVETYFRKAFEDCMNPCKNAKSGVAPTLDSYAVESCNNKCGLAYSAALSSVAGYNQGSTDTKAECTSTPASVPVPTTESSNLSK